MLNFLLVICKFATAKEQHLQSQLITVKNQILKIYNTSLKQWVVISAVQIRT